jgi:MFS family permease
MALVAGFATPLIGLLVHSLGPRKVIGIGAVVTGSGYLLFSLATKMSHLYFLAFLIGIGLSATTLVPNQTIVSHWFVKKRGTAMGIAMMGVGFGGIVWASLAHELIDRFRWQGAFVIFGLVIPLVLLPLAIFVIRKSPQSMGLEPDGIPEQAEMGPGAGAAAGNQSGFTVGQAVRTASFWYLFCVNFFMILGTSIITQHTVAIVTGSGLGRTLGVEEAMSLGAHAITYFLAVSIAGRLCGGFLAERFSKRLVMSAAYLLMIISTLLLFRLNSISSLYIFVLLYGFGMGASAVIYPLILAEIFGLLSFSKLLGLMGIPFTLGAAIGVVGAARIYDVMKAAQAPSPYAPVFILLAAVFALSCFLVLLAKPAKIALAGGQEVKVGEQEPA